MQSFGCVLKRRCTERCTFSENLPEGWNGGTALEKKQEDGRFCRAYLRTMDPEQAAAEIGRRDGYAMLGQKGTQQKLERMRCDAAAQLKREDVLRQLARLAFGRVDDAVTLALRRGETEPEGLELSAVSELRVTEKGVEVKLVDRVRALETLWKLLEASEPQQADPLYQALAALPQADYIDLLAALAAENGSGDEELLLSARDREAVGAAVVDAANARKPGASFHLSGETRDTGGGLVLRRGRVELNCSFTEKLRQLRQEESSAVARLLFD